MKKILLSLLTIGAVSLASIGATGAYFSVTSVSTQNTFTTGTLAVGLSDDVTYPGSTAEFAQIISNSYGGVNLKPGDVLPEQQIRFINGGSLDGHHLDLLFNHVPHGSANLGDYIIYDELLFGPDKAHSVDILAQLIDPSTGATDPEYTLFHVNGAPLTSLDTNHDGKLTQTELSNSSFRIRMERGTEGEAIDSLTTATLWIKTRIDSALTVQGISADAIFAVRIDQDASQL